MARVILLALAALCLIQVQWQYLDIIYYNHFTLCRFLAQRGPEEIHEGDQEVCDHRQDLQQEQQQPQQRACVLQQQHQQPQQQLWLQEHKEVIFQQ